MGNEQRTQGSTEEQSRLAGIPKRFEAGLALRRLDALADFIAPLAMMPAWHEQQDHMPAGRPAAHRKAYRRLPGRGVDGSSLGGWEAGASPSPSFGKKFHFRKGGGRG